MNFLSHGFRYLDNPYVVAGSAVPDWLSVVDRKIRARSKRAQLLLESDDPITRDVAIGVIKHHHDDNWFHSSRLFNETMLQFAIELREHLPGDEGFRPSFVGHISVEILMDGTLIARDRSLADRYYQSLASVSPEKVQAVVNLIAGTQTTALASTISRFVNARFLYDYLDDDKLLFRLNQVMSRVNLPALPDSLLTWLATARRVVEVRCDALLTPIHQPAA